MTFRSKLVERLREAFWQTPEASGKSMYWGKLMKEAADALEAKDAEIAELKADNERLRDLCGEAQDPLCQKCNKRVPVTAVAALKNMKPICVDCFYVTDADRQLEDDDD